MDVDAGFAEPEDAAVDLNARCEIKFRFLNYIAIKLFIENFWATELIK